MTTPVEPVLAWPLTPAELAAYLKVSKWWIYQQVRCGALETTALGNNYRFTREQVETWLAKQKHQVVVPATPTRAEVAGIRARAGRGAA